MKQGCIRWTEMRHYEVPDEMTEAEFMDLEYEESEEYVIKRESRDYEILEFGDDEKF